MQLGAQIYALGESVIRKESQAIFDRFAAMEYQGIEMPFMMDIKDALNQSGLKYSALHVGPDLLVNPQNLIEHMLLSDCRHLCLSGPIGWHDRTLENFQTTSSLINEKAAMFLKEGIQVHYHNHDFEFLPLGSLAQRPIDILLSELDPNLVNLCVDTGWLNLVGTCPITFLSTHKNRISYVHLRDFKGSVSSELGGGQIDLTSIVDEIKTNSAIDWVVIELDPVPYIEKKFENSRVYLAKHGCL
ncbi:sugar phosphate isomerase/epimerase family protein [Enterovibrio coralii]|uniref:Xylose isomerase-like TIM barrel domain-containing protein n=1 Tax=Enterovibrio coralii TaxID=294935 RepID=A0A135ID21_9GAMM|nr:sugar phosphate isomerase/epimerase [Enterovibrio coralii]KXF83339.1 hypothetical protein ATN88_06655 [Enterovibrio coralii]